MMNTDKRVFDLVIRVADPLHRRALTLDSLLLEEKILDSFGLIQLVAEIDSEFLIVIKTEDLILQNFATIKDIGALVKRYITDGK
jgi:acyl carrier protein